MSVIDAVLCIPVVDEHADRVAPGSVIRKCVDCARRVWASPASIEQVTTTNTVLVCLDCGGDRILKDPEPELSVMPGTAREFDAWLRRN